MAVVTRMSEQEYREFALTEEGHRYELWDGVPVEKPGMSIVHDGFATFLLTHDGIGMQHDNGPRNSLAKTTSGHLPWQRN